MHIQQRFTALCGVMLSLSLCAPSAKADWLSFENITHNDPHDAAIGEAQFGLNISEYASGQVLFEYANQGPEPCTLTQIYLEKGMPLELNSIWNNPGLVQFTADPKLQDLPGGKSLDPNFLADKLLSAGADAPSPHLGVNPGESLAMLYDLDEDTSYETFLQQLKDQYLRVGIHVQAFESGGSESYIAVPEPGMLILAILSTFCLFKKQR